MNGLVVKNTGNDVWVRFDNGQTRVCKVKGNFRIQGIRSTNPVVVGDIVEVDDNSQISSILPRKNHIARRPVNLSRQIHIIAANIDVALLVVTLRHPETSLTFIDRFIASAEAYSVETIIVFNKMDILGKNDSDELQHIVDVYENIGYRCIKTVATRNEGLEEIKAVISGKVALLSGNSGVGKSTLINSILGDARAKTAEISAYHHKGMHTTTFSEIYCLDDNTYIIDTPGVKGFGAVDMDKDEISHYFVDIFAKSKECRYPNCTHIHEPECAVRQAVTDGAIADSRYTSYLSMVEEVASNDKYRLK